MSLTDDLSPSKPSKASKRGDKGSDSLAGVALATKATIKFVKSFNSLKSDTFKPFHPSLKNQITLRASLVTEDKVGENVNFNDPKDQKLVADILALRPQRRMEDEIAVLKKAFRDVDFFKKVENEMDEASFTAIFQALRLEYFRAGQKVFSHGDIGKTFYIIIKGSVYILLKTEGVVHTDESQALPISLILQNDELYKHKEALGTFLQSDASQDAKREMVEKCYPGFWIVQEKLKGDSFGDLALSKNSNRLRTATVVCSDDTVFGILSFNDYQSILGALQEKKFTENIDCLSNVNIFKHWKHNQMSSLLMSAEEVKLTRNQVIFKEGDAPKLLYFIKQGEVELRKAVDMEIKDDNLEEFGASLMNKQTVAKTKGWKKQEPMRLGILTKGDYFGEGEVITVKPREYSAIVYSGEVLLISIPRDKFLGFVKDKTSLQSFETHVKNKKQWRDNLIKKMVTLRSEKSASPSTTQSLQSSPTIKVVKRSTVIMTEGPMDSPTKRGSVRKAFEERSGSLVLEDRFDLHSPALSARSSRIIVSFAGSIPGSPQAKLLEEPSPPKTKKDKPARLMSSGFSFTQMKMTSDKSPLYERQKEKIERKLQQDRQELNLQLNLHKVKSSENDEGPKSATIKSKPSQTTRASVKVPSSASIKGSLWPTLENFDSSPVSTKTARESIVRSSLIMADPMVKMCKQLGLDKIYSEKDVRMVSLDGRVCGPIQSLSSLPGVLPDFNKASPKDKPRRPGSVHNIHVKMPGTSTAR